MAERPVVRAAGCVVWRSDGTGPLEILVVRRPAPHDDWSLPKGKLDEGERHRDAAVREVHEETGVRGSLGDKLTEVRYVTDAGEDKRVRWWSLHATGDDGFVANSEISERRWVSVADARSLLTWDTDRSVLDVFTSATP